MNKMIFEITDNDEIIGINLGTNEVRQKKVSLEKADNFRKLLNKDQIMSLCIEKKRVGTLIVVKETQKIIASTDETSIADVISAWEND